MVLDIFRFNIPAARPHRFRAKVQVLWGCCAEPVGRDCGTIWGRELRKLQNTLLYFRPEYQQSSAK